MVDPDFPRSKNKTSSNWTLLGLVSQNTLAKNPNFQTVVQIHLKKNRSTHQLVNLKYAPCRDIYLPTFYREINSINVGKYLPVPWSNPLIVFWIAFGFVFVPLEKAIKPPGVETETLSCTEMKPVSGFCSSKNFSKFEVACTPKIDCLAVQQARQWGQSFGKKLVHKHLPLMVQDFRYKSASIPQMSRCSSAWLSLALLPTLCTASCAICPLHLPSTAKATASMWAMTCELMRRLQLHQNALGAFFCRVWHARMQEAKRHCHLPIQNLQTNRWWVMCELKMPSTSCIPWRIHGHGIFPYHFP